MARFKALLLADAVPEAAAWIRATMTDLLAWDAEPRNTAELKMSVSERQEWQAMLDQIDGLRMLSPCGCGDSFCGSFWTWVGDQDSIAQSRKRCWPIDDSLILDTVDGRISYVEILFQDELRAKILAVFGKSPV